MGAVRAAIPALSRQARPRSAASVLYVGLPHLAAQVAACDGDSPVIVCRNGTGAVLAACPAATAAGVRPGMRASAARALCPAARIVAPGSTALETIAARLVEAAGAYTDRVEASWQTARGAARARALAGSPGVWLDLRGCERLWGGPHAVAAALRDMLAAQGLVCTAGLAAQPPYAALAAALVAPGEIGCIPAGEEAERLAAVPLDTLTTLSRSLRDQLAALRVETAGDLARLPRAGLTRRHGKAAAAAHDLAAGAAQRPVLAPPAPDVLRARATLAEPSADAAIAGQGLARPARRIARLLEARGQAATELTLRVRCAGQDGAPVERHIRLPEPLMGEAALLARFRALLGGIAAVGAIAGPVVAVELQAAGLVAGAVQLAMPLPLARPLAPTPLEGLIEDLRARFGPRAARLARLAPALLPEGRVRWLDEDGDPVRVAPAVGVMPPEGPPQIVRRVGRRWEAVTGIHAEWRLWTRWWADPVHRHYYRLETVSGAVLELYRDLEGGGWRLARRLD